MRIPEEWWLKDIYERRRVKLHAAMARNNRLSCWPKAPGNAAFGYEERILQANNKVWCVGVVAPVPGKNASTHLANLSVPTLSPVHLSIEYHSLISCDKICQVRCIIIHMKNFQVISVIWIILVKLSVIELWHEYNP